MTKVLSPFHALLAFSAAAHVTLVLAWSDLPVPIERRQPLRISIASAASNTETEASPQLSDTPPPNPIPPLPRRRAQHAPRERRVASHEPAPQTDVGLATVQDVASENASEEAPEAEADLPERVPDLSADAEPGPTVMPAPSRPSRIEREAALARYLGAVRSAVELHRRYPYPAKRMGLEGTIYVRVWIRGDGSAQRTRIARTSPHEPLREAALDAVRSAAPFPVVPEELGAQLVVEIPIRFRLGEGER